MEVQSQAAEGGWQRATERSLGPQFGGMQVESLRLSRATQGGNSTCKGSKGRTSPRQVGAVQHK